MPYDPSKVSKGIAIFELWFYLVVLTNSTPTIIFAFWSFPIVFTNLVPITKKTSWSSLAVLTNLTSATIFAIWSLSLVFTLGLLPWCFAVLQTLANPCKGSWSKYILSRKNSYLISWTKYNYISILTAFSMTILTIVLLIADVFGGGRGIGGSQPKDEGAQKTCRKGRWSIACYFGKCCLCCFKFSWEGCWTRCWTNIGPNCFCCRTCWLMQKVKKS